MTDVPPGNVPPNGDNRAGPSPAPHPPFPVVRLFYAAAFAVVAWFVFWLVLMLGMVQFIVILLNGRANPELKSFNLSLVHYLWELLAFIVFARDEQPFPLGPFPHHA